MPDAIYKIENMSKEYKMGEILVRAVDSISLEILRGELCVVLGPSGSGKSTLLNILGGMDASTSGKIYFNGEDISGYGPKQRTFFRRSKIGFVFQFYNLMPSLTARENIELAAEISDNPPDIDRLMKLVGIEERAGHFPAQLSGGEQQKVAIARAVAKNPEVLLCDEPTGALDYSNGIKILELLRDINREASKSVVIITHNQSIACMAHKTIRMRSGEIAGIDINDNPIEPNKISW